MIFHFITGDMAAAPLKDAILSDAGLEGEVVVVKDVLSVGPIQRPEGESFSGVRSAFWQQIMLNEKNPAQPLVEVDDLERVLEIGNNLAKSTSAAIWIWVAPMPADICTYFWVLHYLRKYADRIYIVNIAGLPFLDMEGKLFFPKSISELLPRELVKARKLARLLTKTEIETDSEEWGRLVQENTQIRVHEGGKKIASKPLNHYDAQLLGYCTHQFQKAHKIVGQAISKHTIPTGDMFLGWRLRKMTETGRLLLQGEITGKLKDFEVKLPGEEMQLELGI